jgi:hypothetical protein
MSSSIAKAERGVFVGRVQQRLDLRFAQGLGHAQWLFGRQQAQRGVGGDQPLAQGPAKVALEDGQAPVGRGGPGLRMPVGKVAVDVGLGGRRKFGAPFGQPAVEEAQVAPVGVEGVARQAFFKPEAVDEGRQRGVFGPVARGHQSSLSFWRATTCL